jgi:hypothetical protein
MGEKKMSTERDRILRMVREGKISKEEGDVLLAALEDTAKTETGESTEQRVAPPAGRPSQGSPQAKRTGSPERSTGVMIGGFILLFLFFAQFLEKSALLVLSRPWVVGMKTLHLTHSFVGGWPLNSFSTLFTLLVAIGAVGVLFFREWARKFIVIVLALHAFFSFFVILMVRGMSIARFDTNFLGVLSGASVLGWIMVDIFFIWFFSRASIRPQFS